MGKRIGTGFLMGGIACLIGTFAYVHTKAYYPDQVIIYINENIRHYMGGSFLIGFMIGLFIDSTDKPPKNEK